jgi:hypothetical protein
MKANVVPIAAEQRQAGLFHLFTFSVNMGCEFCTVRRNLKSRFHNPVVRQGIGQPKNRNLHDFITCQHNVSFAVDVA